MFPAYDIVKNALNWYMERDNVAYFMGAKGEVLTDARMDELIRWYPDHFAQYDADKIKKIKQFSRGKIGFDCSGLVSKCVGLSGLSSWTLWDKTTNRTTVKNCKAGSLLWRPGHIGIDIGYGYCIDIPIEGQTIRIIKNTSSSFTNGGEFIGADYSMMSNY